MRHNRTVLRPPLRLPHMPRRDVARVRDHGPLRDIGDSVSRMQAEAMLQDERVRIVPCVVRRVPLREVQPVDVDGQGTLPLRTMRDMQGGGTGELQALRYLLHVRQRERLRYPRM